MAQFFVYALTSSNINRFAKLCHCQNQEKICNNTITKDPTTPDLPCDLPCVAPPADQPTSEAQGLAD